MVGEVGVGELVADDFGVGGEVGDCRGAEGNVIGDGGVV